MRKWIPRTPPDRYWKNNYTCIMKKLLITLLILLGVGAVAVITCPDRQDHKDAIVKVIGDSISDELQGSNSDSQGISEIVGSIGSSVAGYLLDNRLTVKNYFVFSVGELKDFYGEEQRVSVGVFGHVFTGGKEEIKKAINGK